MPEATHLNSMPPKNTSQIGKPADGLSRRHMMAGLAVLSAALPVAAAAEPDPILAAIETHRKAQSTADAKMAEADRRRRLADKVVGPSYIEIPSLVEPGTTAEAICWWDIQRAIPKEQFPELYAHYSDLLETRKTARAEITAGADEDEFTDEEFDAADDALHDLARTVPTTIPGLLTMLIYAGEIWERERDGDDAEVVVASLATAAKALQQRQAVVG